MSEIKNSPIRDLTIGDVFTSQGKGPYVVTHKRFQGNMTLVYYRLFENGKPNGAVFFTRSCQSVYRHDSGPILWS